MYKHIFICCVCVFVRGANERYVYRYIYICGIYTVIYICIFCYIYNRRSSSKSIGLQVILDVAALYSRTYLYRYIYRIIYRYWWLLLFWWLLFSSLTTLWLHCDIKWCIITIKIQSNYLVIYKLPFFCEKNIFLHHFTTFIGKTNEKSTKTLQFLMKCIAGTSIFF